MKGLPALAFDHKLIVRTTFQHILDRHAAIGKLFCDSCQESACSHCTARFAIWTQQVSTADGMVVDKEAACRCVCTAGEHLEPRVREDLQQGSKALEGPWTPPKD